MASIISQDLTNVEYCSSIRSRYTQPFPLVRMTGNPPQEVYMMQSSMFAPMVIHATDSLGFLKALTHSMQIERLMMVSPIDSLILEYPDGKQELKWVFGKETMENVEVETTMVALMQQEALNDLMMRLGGLNRVMQDEFQYCAKNPYIFGETVSDVESMEIGRGYPDKEEKKYDELA